MNTENTAIIMMSVLIVVIYSIRLIVYLKIRRYKTLKSNNGLMYQKEYYVPVTFLKEVYEPDREYDVCEGITDRFVKVKQQVNLN